MLRRMTEADRIQLACIKRLSPDEKLRLSEKMYFEARRLKADWLRQLHPEWSDEQVKCKVREIFVNARS